MINVSFQLLDYVQHIFTYTATTPTVMVNSIDTASHADNVAPTIALVVTAATSEHRQHKQQGSSDMSSSGCASRLSYMARDISLLPHTLLNTHYHGLIVGVQMGL